ncbi:MAG TPA: ferric reductase-like transmembrane domain-containing protein [Solirubrobacteraceae bacterium]|nr:ferric reductase-like transmembrane domain-containing protein [Solirubrobacteraceae bacterium]
MLLTAVVSPSPYWFVTRGTGAVSLVLLTLAIALGVADVRRTRLVGVPRFVFDSVHRSVSLLAVTFIAVHIVTVLLDSFAPITLLDVFIPFHSPYRPIWLGLGTVAFDLLVAVTITSLLRMRLGYRAWRATHWLAYGSWPVALVHGFGTGTDGHTHWLLLLSAACVAVMLTAVVARVSAGWPSHLPARLSALGAAALVPIGLAVWLPSGPMAPGWARRAGTPTAQLVAAHGPAAAGGSASSAAGGSSSAAGGSSTSAGGSSTSAGATGPQTVSVTGTLRQAVQPDNSALIDLSLTTASGQVHNVHIRIRGQALPGGGVQMTTSRVSAGSMANPDQYQGQVTGLENTTVQANVSDGSGSHLALVAQLSLPPGDGGVSGQMTITPTR